MARGAGWETLVARNPQGRTVTGVRSLAEKLGRDPADVYADTDLRRAATGHAQTPRSPHAALRAPEAFPTYANRHYTELRDLAETERGRAMVLRANQQRLEADHVPITWSRPDDLEPGHPSGEAGRGSYESIMAYLEEGNGTAAIAAGVVVVYATGDPETPFGVYFFDTPGKKRRRR